MKIDIRIIASLLTAPFIILICIGELFLIIWIILKSLGCLFYFVTRLAKKKGTNILNKDKSRKTKSDGREKRKAIFEAKTKCAQKSRLLPPSGQNTSVVQTPFESCLNDAFLLNFLLKYHLKTHCQFSKKSYLYIVVMLPLCIPSRPHS